MRFVLSSHFWFLKLLYCGTSPRAAHMYLSSHFWFLKLLYQKSKFSMTEGQQLSSHFWFLKLLYSQIIAQLPVISTFIPLLVFKIIVLPLPMPLISFAIFCPVREPLSVERASGHREKEVIQYSLCIQGVVIPRTPRFLMITLGFALFSFQRAGGTTFIVGLNP